MKALAILLFIIGLLLSTYGVLQAQQTTAPDQPIVITQTAPAAPLVPSQLITNPQPLIGITASWIAVLSAIAAILSGFIITIRGDINKITTKQIQQDTQHSDLANTVANVALNVPPPGTANLQAVSKAASILLILCLLWLPGCASQSPPTQAQVTNGILTGLQVASIALNDYAVLSGKGANAPTTAQKITLVQNNLNSLAALAQANVGSTPIQANLASGSAIPAVGNSVVATLPNVPISQNTVNLLYTAAAVVPQAAATPVTP